MNCVAKDNTNVMTFFSDLKIDIYMIQRTGMKMPIISLLQFNGFFDVSTWSLSLALQGFMIKCYSWFLVGECFGRELHCGFCCRYLKMTAARVTLAV